MTTNMSLLTDLYEVLYGLKLEPVGKSVGLQLPVEKVVVISLVQDLADQLYIVNYNTSLATVVRTILSKF